MTQPMTTAMVFAAGLGLRMRPLTDTIPKPMVQLRGRPMIDHVLDRLDAACITTVVVNVHYRADVLEAHLKTRLTPRILISDERDRLLDTGGGLVKARPLLGAGPVLVHNSDSVWLETGTPNIGRLIAAFDGACMDALLLLAPRSTSLGYSGRGDFALAGDGRLRRPAQGGPGKGEEAPFVFTGVSIAHMRLLDAATPEPFSLNRLWDNAIANGRVFGLPFEGTWMHVGDPASLAEAEMAMERAAHG